MNIKTPSQFAVQLALKAEEAHRMSREKGFYDGVEPSALERHMLVVSEIAEATEEVRKGTPEIYFPSLLTGKLVTLAEVDQTRLDFHTMKPEGELIELADAVIRILDYCAHKGFNIGEAIELKMAYNATRGYRHGNKRY